MTKTLALATLALVLAGAPTLASADPSCAAQAAEKKLGGAAKTSFIKKCAADAAADCERQAAAKKLGGAAKTSFNKKCAAAAG